MPESDVYLMPVKENKNFFKIKTVYCVGCFKTAQVVVYVKDEQIYIKIISIFVQKN